MPGAKAKSGLSSLNPHRGPLTEGEGIMASTVLTSRRFVDRVAWTFATRLAMVVGGFGSSIVAARWLGAQGFGELAVVNLTGALALQIGSAGLPSAMIYFVAKNRKHLAGESSNALLFAIVAGSALTLTIVGLSWLDPALFGYVPTKLLAIGAISIPFLLITLLGMNLMLAIERVAQFNLLDGAAPLLVLFHTVTVLILMRSGLTTLISFNTVA